MQPYTVTVTVTVTVQFIHICRAKVHLHTSSSPASTSTPHSKRSLTATYKFSPCKHSHRVPHRTTASSNTTNTPNYNKRRLQRRAFFYQDRLRFTSHTERSCTTSATSPTEHQRPVDANSSSKSQVANTITTLFGPSSTRPTFVSHERDEILHLLHLDLSARRRPVQLVIALSLTIIRYQHGRHFHISVPPTYPLGPRDSSSQDSAQVKTQGGTTVPRLIL